MGVISSSMKPILSLDDLNERVEHVAKGFVHRQLWFRGQRNADWQLHASIFRPSENRQKVDDVEFAKMGEREREIANTFRQRAPMRGTTCLADDDDFGWLALMRHYYAACRLLDWSESALVALYCAVHERVDKAKDTDSRLWFLDPAGLNKHSVVSSSGTKLLRDGRPLTPNDMLVKGRAAAAFARIVEIPNRRPKGPPIAVVPRENNNRMLVQSSVFTLHSDKSALDDCAFDGQVVCSAVIPKEARHTLRETLNNLGINRYQLFPDLEDLATWLNDTVLGRAQPPDGADESAEP